MVLGINHSEGMKGQIEHNLSTYNAIIAIGKACVKAANLKKFLSITLIVQHVAGEQILPFIPVGSPETSRVHGLASNLVPQFSTS